MSRVLLSVPGFDEALWQSLLASGRTVTLLPDGHADPSIDYAVVWKYPHGLLTRLPNLKAVFSGGAGVDHVLADPDLPDVPLIRVISPDLTAHMRDYVVWRVTDHHRQGMAYRNLQAAREWRELDQPAARDVSVGLMGMGELGSAAAAALASLGYRVNGWSRSGRPVSGVTSFAGQAALGAFLAATDILVVLLPLTPATRGVIDHGLLSKLRRDNALGGAILVNAGRGQLQKDADILRALDDGTLKEASLDVFEAEPLPKASPLWSHPRVFVTPHAAAPSDPHQLVPAMLRQMELIDQGVNPAGLVDRATGY